MNTDSKTNEDQLRAVINMLPEGYKVRYICKILLFKLKIAQRSEF